MLAQRGRFQSTLKEIRSRGQREPSDRARWKRALQVGLKRATGKEAAKMCAEARQALKDLEKECRQTIDMLDEVLAVEETHGEKAA